MAIGVFELDEVSLASILDNNRQEYKKIGIPIDTEKVTAFVTDSGANRNDKSYTYETFGVNKHIPCFAHMINRVAEEAINNFRIEGRKRACDKY